MNPNPPPRADARAPRSILLIRLRRIGDIVLTMPALGVLRAAYPEASLTYAVEEPFRRLVEGHPDLDRALVLPARMSNAAFLRLLVRIRRGRYDAVIDFHGGPRAAWMTLASRAPVRVGYDTGAKGRVYSRRVPRAAASGAVHSVVNHANLVRALTGVETEIPAPRLPDAGGEETIRVDRLLSAAGLAGARFVAVHIGAGNAFRDWDAASYARLLDRLRREGGAAPVLVGGPADRVKDAEIRALAGAPVASLTGCLNLIELKDLIARAALFVGPDSGPMHIASATPTPIVAVFGPTLPAHFAPWRSRVRVVEAPLDCRPCRQRHCQRHDFQCIKGITSDEVYEACRSFLRA